MTETYKTVQVAGMLLIPGTDDDIYWYLLKPYPVQRADDWVRDDMTTFYVCHYHSRPFHIIVRGPFVISYHNAGQEIEIKEEAVEDNWMEDLLKAEPASLAED